MSVSASKKGKNPRQVWLPPEVYSIRGSPTYSLVCSSVGDVPRAEYEELKAAKEKAEEDTIFSFKRKKGCQAERKQVCTVAQLFSVPQSMLDL